jgi:NAD(P)-dependent dehydrogenase (short-subunit alcohol dehydrogenase family)
MKIIALLIACTTFLLAQEKRVVLITGASKGIGLATAKSFQEKGWTVWATSRSPLENPIPGTKHTLLDVTKQNTIDAAIATIMEEENQIDVIINNAGYGLIGTEETVSMGQVRKLFDTNFYGPLRLIQAVAPIMRSQKRGHIINISSTSGVRAVTGLGLYAASKHALEGMSESLAVHLAPWNIHVSLIQPGSVQNDFFDHIATGNRTVDTPFYEKLTENLISALKKLSQSAQSCVEIANLIVTVAEDPHPHLRYPTSEKVEQVVKKKYADPTGNDAVFSQTTYLRSLMDAD